MERHNEKVLPVRRFNLVHLIFLILFVYLIVILARYMMKEDVKVTEISEGTLTQNHNYNGLIIRDEEVLNSDMAGYLTCFTNDGQCVAKNKILYVIDKTGKTLKATTEYASTLSDAQLKTLRKSLNYFNTSYDGQEFSKVYDFKSQLDSLIFDMEQTSAKKLKSSKKLSVVRSDDSGTVYFTLDGYESVDWDSVTRTALKNLEYGTTRFITGDRIEENIPVCKLIKSETWSVIIPITDEDAEYYQNKTSATVRFTDIDEECQADIEIYTDDNGEKLAKVTMSKYMASYSGDRVISIQLVKELKSGLKVPKSSVVSRELYTIPIEYGFKDNTSESVSFWKKTKDGPERIRPSISYSDSMYYYLDENQVDAGDEICMPDKEGNVSTDSTFTVGNKKGLDGVYNVNKGYALFEVVDIVDENDSYCIVEGGTTYGLAVFDHIVLNASSIKEDDLLY